MYTVLINKGKGTVMYLDINKLRYNRLVQRVRDWADLAGTEGRLYMYTLTYDTKGTLRKAAKWSPNHIREFMLSLRVVLGKDLYAYAWVAELTKAGVIHYHVLARVKEGVHMPHPDTDGMWRWGMTRLDVAKTPWYIVKYIGKTYQKDFDKYPKGCRLFAVWLSGEKNVELRYRSLHQWEKEIVDKYGWDYLPDYRKPESGYQYVGTSLSKAYAEYIAKSAYDFEFAWLAEEIGDEGVNVMFRAGGGAKFF